MTTETTNLKIAATKRGHRVWLDGKRLERFGWHHGEMYSRTVAFDTITLTLDPEGNLAVSGASNRPVIDLSGKWVTAWAGDALRCDVVFNGNTITITRGA